MGGEEFVRPREDGGRVNVQSSHMSAAGKLFHRREVRAQPLPQQGREVGGTTASVRDLKTWTGAFTLGRPRTAARNSLFSSCTADSGVRE